MDDPRWRRIKELFAAAAELGEAEREALLDRECAGDADVRREVESLLRARVPTAGVPPVSTPIEEGPGARIGPYKLLQAIGEGTFGVVFLAEQEAPVRRRVALKIIKLGMDTRQVVARFEQERQALALMDHPNIARVFDAGATASGRPYFVMELVRGDPITAYCDREKLDPAERLALFADVCRAVQHAHQKGVIHRDLKPSNVLVTIVDGRPVPKVIDFGVAKATNARLTEKTLFTEHRSMVGTPLYMSPEQADLSGVDVDTRSDVYSLGVLLYELLTGTTPLESKQLLEAGYAEIHRRIRDLEPPKPSTRVGTLGGTLPSVAAQRRVEPRRLGLLLRGDLDWITMKCLEKERARRYATAVGVAEDVERHLRGEPVEAAPPSTAYRVRKLVRRKKGLVAATTAVVLVGIVGFGATVWQAKRAEREAKQSEEGAIALQRSERTRADDAAKAAAVQRELAQSESEARARADRSADEARRSAVSESAAREDAERKTADALRAREDAEYEFYVANIAAASAALRDGEFEKMHTALELCPARFRNWEWGYLDSMGDLSLSTVRWTPLRSLSPFHDAVAALSHDGTLVAALYNDNSIHIRDIRSGQLVAILRGWEGVARGVAFSGNDRRLLVSGSSNAFVWNVAGSRDLDGPSLDDDHLWEFSIDHEGTHILGFTQQDQTTSLRMWQVQPLRELWRVQLNVPLDHALLTPDDSKVVTFPKNPERNGPARVWSAASGTPLAALEDTETPTATWCGGQARQYRDSSRGPITRDGSHIVLPCSDTSHSARIVQLQSGAVEATLKGDGDEVNEAVFSSDGARLVTISSAGAIRVWNWREGVKLTEFRDEGIIEHVTLNADGTSVLVLHSTEIHIYDTSTGTLRSRLRGHERNIIDARFSNVDARVVSIGEDSTARLWDANTPTHPAVFAGGSNGGDYVDNSCMEPFISADSACVLTCEDSHVSVYDLKTCLRVSILTREPADPHPAIFCTYGRILSLWNDGVATLSDPATADIVTQFRFGDPECGPVAAAVDSGGVIAATGDRQDGTKLWELGTGREIHPNRTALEGWCAQFTSNGRQLVTWYPGPPVITDLVTGASSKPDAFNNFNWPITVHSRNDVIVFAPEPLDGTLRSFDISTGVARVVLTGVKLPEYSGGVLYASALSPDGSRIVTNGKIPCLWDGRAGAAVAELPMARHQGFLCAARFSPDGTRFATSGGDSTARMWDASSGREMLRLEWRDEQVGPFTSNVAFSEDGSRLVLQSVRATTCWDSVRYSKRMEGRDMSWSDGVAAAESHTRERIEREIAAGRAFGDIDVEIGGALPDAEPERTGALVALCSHRETLRVLNLAAWAAVVGPTPDVVSTCIAVGVAKGALEMSGGDPDIRNTLGVALFRVGRYEQAIEELMMAARDHGTANAPSPFDWACIAMCQARLGRSDEARGALKRARAILASAEGDDNAARFVAEARGTVREALGRSGRK